MLLKARPEGNTSTLTPWRSNMTAAQWEMFIERAGIFEYEAPDVYPTRKAATLAAFALYFPEEYRERVREGESALYEYLEGLIKAPRTHENGPPLDEDAKNMEKYVWAADSPSIPRYEGLQGLEYMASHNIPLIGVYMPSGATIAKQEPENYTTDPREIAALMEGKGDRHGRGKGTPIQRFYFIPADAGLLCLDIDRKPGKPDGLQELYKLFPRDTLPRALQDIDRFFPCYVATPSGGYHLYFKYKGPPVKKTNLALEVEVKHGRPGLTAPGSRKENGLYVLHGELENAPPLYGIIIDRIAEPQKPQRAAADTPRYRQRKPRITLDALADEATAAYSGHHDRQVSFAGKACRCKFSFSEALTYVHANPGIFGNGKDTEGTIKSVFNDKGGI